MQLVDREETDESARLVIVANDSTILEAIRLGLRGRGEFTPVWIPGGLDAEASEILAAAPDAVLVDDPEQPAHTLRLIGELKSKDERLTIVVLAREVQALRLHQMFAAGATAVISKAAHPATLLTLVRASLKGHLFVSPFGGRIGGHQSANSAEAPSLSQRELEILLLVAAGASNGEIARQLWVTEQTVKFHLRNVYRKLKVTNRTQAGHYAHVNGLVDPHLNGHADGRSGDRALRSAL